MRFRSASNADSEEIFSLVSSILREYGLKPEPEGTDKDLKDIEGNYINRNGLFEVIIDEGGKIIGSVGLYPMDENTIELRKMYFAKELRGKGIGKETLARMIEEAKKRGFKRIYLETASPLKEAIHLYKKFGFRLTSEMHSPRCDQAYELEV